MIKVNFKQWYFFCNSHDITRACAAVYTCNRDDGKPFYISLTEGSFILFQRRISFCRTGNKMFKPESFIEYSCHSVPLKFRQVFILQRFFTT